MATLSQSQIADEADAYLESRPITVRMDAAVTAPFTSQSIRIAKQLLQDFGVRRAIHVAQATADSPFAQRHGMALVHAEAARILERGFVAGKMAAARLRS